MAANFVRDSDGIEQVLKVNCRAIISALGREVAANTRSLLPVDAGETVADDYTTDRAASSVTIKDTRARGWQVQDGVLTRAAAMAGLQVRSRV